MGMFTQLSHHDKLYQFKTGWDDLRIYRVGDTIPWEPDPRYPGQHIDGVYDTIGPDLEDGPWVVICGRQITNVVQRLPGDTAEQIAADYRIEPPPRELWSELEWAEHEAREAQAELAYQRYKAANPKATAISFYVHSRMQEQPFMSRLMPAKRVSRGLVNKLREDVAWLREHQKYMHEVREGFEAIVDDIEGTLPVIEQMLEALEDVDSAGFCACCCGETPCCGSCTATMVADAIKRARGE